MAIEVNHMIIPARDKWASAQFLAGILGVVVSPQWGPFAPGTRRSCEPGLRGR
jgi:hypothetical protein